MGVWGQVSLSLAAPAPALSALSACSGLQLLRLSDSSMLSNRITGQPLNHTLSSHLGPIRCLTVMVTVSILHRIQTFMGIHMSVWMR